MKRARHAWVMVLLLAIAGIAITTLRRCDTPKPRSLEPRLAPDQFEAKAGRNDAPELTGGRADAALRQAYPLIHWKDVPDSIVLWPTSLYAASTLSDEINPNTSYQALFSMVSREGGKLTPEAADRLISAWGLLNCVDYLLGEAAGVPRVSSAVMRNLEHFVPLCVVHGFRAPQDARDALARLDVLLTGGIQQLVERVPQQFRADGLEAAFKTRALVFLGSLAQDEGHHAIIRRYLADQDPRIRASAAIALLHRGIPEEADRILTAERNNVSFGCVAGALAAFEYDVRHRTVNGIGEHYEAPITRLGRSLDHRLLALARQNDMSPAFSQLMSSLTVRLDNPSVRTYVVSSLSTTNDPAVAASIVRVKPDLDGSAEYATALKRWFRSQDVLLQQWALEGMCSVHDSEIPALVTPLLERGQPAVTSKALTAIMNNALVEPEVALKAVRDFMRRDPVSETHKRKVITILQKLHKAPTLPVHVRVEVAKVLDELK